MITRTASARYQGMGKDGQGWVSTQSGVLKDQKYGFNTRFEDGPGTNPEELIAAAHAGCFAMQLSHFLAENGTPAEKLDATATIHYGPAEGGGFAITESAIALTGTVPGIDDAKFQELATKAKEGCPVSKALGAIKVSLDAKLG